MASARNYSVAMLVMAHNEPELLKLLLSRLVEDFDVYVHIDKASEKSLERVIPHSSRIIRVKSRRAPWGRPHIVGVQRDLLAAAATRGYDRYVLISGQCVPLLSNAGIKATLQRSDDVEWIGADELVSPKDDGFIHRVTRVYWHAPWRYSGLRRVFYLLVEYFLEGLYRTILPKRKGLGPLFFGQTWFALTHRAVESALSFIQRSPDFGRMLRGARLAEEIYLPTAVRRSMPEGTRYGGPPTYIDWFTGPEKPRTLDMSDVDRLRESPLLFARKFTWAKSRELVERLYQETASKG